jgi:ubiquinol-cytochrome c reductase subunit 6
MGLSDFFSSFIPTVYADEEPQVEEVVEEEVVETPVEEEEEEEEEEPEDPKEAIWEGNFIIYVVMETNFEIKHFKSINQI